MSNALFCPKCLRHFPVSRQNCRHQPTGVQCRICKGSGETTVKDEKGQLVPAPCDFCEGEGTVYATATCTLRRGETYCGESHPVPKKMQARLPWLGRPNPSTGASMRERGLTPRPTEGRRRTPWPKQ